MLHALRKVRNKATHEDYESIEDCKNYLPVTHSIATWFYGVYGDYDFQPASFEMPFDLLHNPDGLNLRDY